jgi:hypothetical protein
MLGDQARDGVATGTVAARAADFEELGPGGDFAEVKVRRGICHHRAQGTDRERPLGRLIPSAPVCRAAFLRVGAVVLNCIAKPAETVAERVLYLGQGVFNMWPGSALRDPQLMARNLQRLLRPVQVIA